MRYRKPLQRFNPYIKDSYKDLSAQDYYQKAIFELFNDSGCVSIPTIAGMVGSDETTYCPWFDSSVRNILTPVFGFSSMILLFGFVIYWLRGGSSDILYKGGK